MDSEARRHLQLLEAVEEDSRVTQRGLATKLGIALGLTNIYLKRLVRKVVGGGVSGQAGAILHATARALLKADEANKAVLREAGMLTRDPREKERKKYGLKRARRAKQYTKR